MDATPACAAAASAALLTGCEGDDEVGGQAPSTAEPPVASTVATTGGERFPDILEATLSPTLGAALRVAAEATRAQPVAGRPRSPTR